MIACVEGGLSVFKARVSWDAHYTKVGRIIVAPPIVREMIGKVFHHGGRLSHSLFRCGGGGGIFSLRSSLFIIVIGDKLLKSFFLS